jgi:hypothetical protein
MYRLDDIPENFAERSKIQGNIDYSEGQVEAL